MKFGASAFRQPRCPTAQDHPNAVTPSQGRSGSTAVLALAYSWALVLGGLFSSLHASAATVTCTVLEPGAWSWCTGVGAKYEVGTWKDEGPGYSIYRAKKWSGSPGSVRDITPGPPVGEFRWEYYQGEAFAVDGETVVGRAWGWGDNCSFVLPPGGSIVKLTNEVVSGNVTAISGNQIVGGPGLGAGSAWLASIAGPPYVNLHPPGWAYSSAQAVHSGRQAGLVVPHQGHPQAALWSGSAASFVNLHPEGYWRSEVRGIWGQVQVGRVVDVYTASHAALWRGSAASFTNLHPAGASSSWINGVHGAYQAGAAKGATLWKGSADRTVSLHRWLDFSMFADSLEEAASEATAIWTDEANQLIRVVGHASGPKTANRTRAVLWTIRGDPTAPSLPVVGTTNLPVATAGTAYSQTLSATDGAPPYAWSLASGALPAGLALSPAGVLSGTPTSAGVASFVVQVKDSANATGTQSLSLRVAPPALRVVTSALPPGTARAAYLFSLQATGGVPPYAWSVSSGSLPAGLGLSPGGLLSGTPVAAGNPTFTVQVRDAADASSTASLVLGVNPAPPLGISVGGGEGSAGTEVVVPVRVEAFTAIAGLQFSLRWSPSVLTFGGLERLGLASMGPANFNTNNARAGGSLSFSWEDTDGTGKSLPAGSTLFAVRFRLTGAPGSSDTVRVTGDPTAMEAIDAEVHPVPMTSVSEPVRISRTVQISGVVRRPDGVQPAAGVRVDLAGDTTQTVTTGADGAWAFTVNQGGTYTVTPTQGTPAPASAGISTADVLLIRRHVLGLAALDSPFKVLAADASASASVTSADLVSLRRVILGTADSLPSGPWRFVRSGIAFANPQSPWGAESNRAYTGLQGNLGGQDFVAVRMGDVNQSWTPAGGTGAGPVLHASGPTVRVQAGEVPGRPGETVDLPVTVADFRGVTSLQFSMAWDATRLAYEGTRAFGLTGVSDGSFNASASEGWLAFAWDDPGAIGVDLPDHTPLFVARFRVTATEDAPAVVRFTDHPTVREVTVNSLPSGLIVRDGRIGTGSQGEPLRLELHLIGEVPEVTIHGPLGARVEIQAAEHFGAAWEPRIEVVLETGPRSWRDEQLPLGSGRLYRALLR